MTETPQTPVEPDPKVDDVTVVNITPANGDVKMIHFNITGIGKFDLPVLGHKNTPYGISSAFSIWQSIDKNNKAQVASAWGHLSAALANMYPEAVMVLAHLDEDTVGHVFEAWHDQSRGYDPKAN